ncbi:MAG: hypothetical protein HY321_15220 [Armatimonadetes bacterium]|nr:hypothetical protein [Armatimonadota bacterium]
MRAAARVARLEARAGEVCAAWFARLTEQELGDLVARSAWPERLAEAPAWVRRELSNLVAEFRVMSDEELLSLLAGAPVLPAPGSPNPPDGCA